MTVVGRGPPAVAVARAVPSIVYNSVANLLMRLFPMVLQFAAVPLILRAVGPDYFGLYTLYNTLAATLFVFDQGVSTTMFREPGRLDRDQPAGVTAFRRLARALELVSMGTGLAIGLGLAALASVLAQTWLSRGGLDPAQVASVLRIMGVTLMCQWTAGFYSAAYAGLQRQTALLPVTLCHAGLMIGVNLILAFATRDVGVLLAWQALSWLGYVLVARWRLQSLLPGDRGRFGADWAGLRRIWRFTLGTTIVGLTSAILAQADNIIVARYVTLDQVAAYGLCFSASSLIAAAIAGPVYSASFPILTRLSKDHDEAGLAQAYHKMVQMVAVLAVPAAGALIVFPEAVLGLWLGPNSPLVDTMSRWLPIVAAGSLLNAFAVGLSTLQFAAGAIRIAVGKNLLAVPLFVGSLLLTVPVYGPVAGAACWLALNAGYCLLEAPVMHRRLLRGHLLAWYVRDSFGPALLGFAPILLARWLCPAEAGALERFGFAVTGCAAASGILVVLLRHPRSLVTSIAARLFSRARSMRSRRGPVPGSIDSREA